MAVRKIWLNINGADRILVCDPEKDTLADVLRRTGLTGTKVGCNYGQCGACTVLLDGEVVRSCVKKIKNIPEYARVETIEGIGTANNLHPLQAAFISYGALQCGFCTSGFILSAKGLLNVNLKPTRQDVRNWFTKNHNLCRCTGYKPIVDAVIAAAEVMRGEKTMQDLQFVLPKDGRLYGSNAPKPTGISKVTGACDYGNDIALKMPAGTLHLAIVQAKVNHAKIKGIDFRQAEAMSGVVKVVTAKDVKGINRITIPMMHPHAKANGCERPIICDDKVFRYGDVVAVVAARTVEEARAAAKEVKVDLELLPEYMSYLDAVAPDAIRVHEESPNLFLQMPVIKGEDTRKILDKADAVVEGSFYSTREPHLSIESDIMQAYWDEEGRIAIQCKSQGIFMNIFTIAQGIGMPPDKIRIIENPTGGTFGYATTPGAPALAAVCAMAVNQPVSLELTYGEHQHFSGKRTASYANTRLACSNDGKIQALEFDLAYDHGAYSEVAEVLVSKGLRFIGFPYNIPNLRGLSRTAFTNHNFGTAYRSFGGPQCFTSSEAIMDMMAEKLGMDPFDFRYINIARPGDTTNNSYPYREYPMQEIMDKMRPVYEAAKARAKAESTPERRRGVGIALGGYHVSGNGDNAEIDIQLNPDGSVTHFNTWEDVGQGSDVGTLVHVHEALRPLNLRIGQIKMIQNDSGICPDSGIAAGSRCHYLVGNATINGCNQLLDAMRKEDGTYRTYQEMAAEGIPTKYRGRFSTSGTCIDLDPNTGAGDPVPEVMYGGFISEVEVDAATGKTMVVGMTVVADVGVVGTLQGVNGQAWGGMSHSIGFALSENYDDVKKHETMVGAGIPSCNDIPDRFNAIYCENPRTRGPHGSCGCSEVFQSAGHVAVINAINNAVGVRIYELPALSEKVKAAMDAKAKGQELKPDKYYLGSEFYETLDEMQANPVEVKREGHEDAIVM